MRLEAPIGIVATTYIRQVLADEHRSALDVISGWDIERHRTTLDESRDDKRDLDARATNVEAQTHQAWRRRRVNSKSMMNSQETAVGRKTAEGLLYSVPLRKFRGGFHVASHSVQSAPTVSRAMIHEVENTASPLERKKPASKFSMRQKNAAQYIGHHPGREIHVGACTCCDWARRRRETLAARCCYRSCETARRNLST